MGIRIDFANAILKNEKTFTGEPRVYYILRRYKKMGSFDILTHITEHVNMVQFMNYWGNVNHSISVVGYWIFQSKYERALVLDIESLDMICALSVGEEKLATSEIYFCAVRSIC